MPCKGVNLTAQGTALGINGIKVYAPCKGKINFRYNI